MKRAVRLLLVLLVCSLQNVASADTAPVDWLKRMVQANASLDYSGTFIYQSGNTSESSRIVHGVDNGREMEWIEVLDGPPREVLRKNDEVRAFLPGEKRVVVENRSGGRGFPGKVTVAPDLLLDYYTLKVGAGERIAGHEARLLVLEPRDTLRFGHRFWIEANNALLLKAQVVDGRGQVIEQFSFTQLSIGSPIDFEAIKGRWQQPLAGWQVDNLLPGEVVSSTTGWGLRRQVAGFHKISEWRRRLGDTEGSVLHLLFSDGVAAISVFIAPVDKTRPIRSGTSSQGGVSMHVRQMSDHVITAVGEAPPATVRKIADSLELKR